MDAAAATTTTRRHCPASDPRFSCNICFDDVSDPVVTQCGHLYCWGCLFRWIEPGLTYMERQALNLPANVGVSMTVPVDQSHRVCPVCKSPCSVTSVIPIYVRNDEQQNHTSNINSNNVPLSTTSLHNQASRDYGGLSEPENSPESFDDSVNFELNNPPEDSLTDETSPSGDFGLRQRLRFRSSDSQIPNASDATASTVAGGEDLLPPPEVVPARPVPRRRRSFSENAVGNLQNQTLSSTSSFDNSNSNRAFAISQGLALSLHRALGPNNDATTNNSGNNPSASTVSAIPPLHRREGHGSAARVGAASQALQDETDPDATEFLSRILLMLGSFVVLCLLLF